MQLISQLQHCPYCDASIELVINPEDAGVEYIEDCAVCCQPIRILAEMDSAGGLAGIRLLREDD